MRKRNILTVLGMAAAVVIAFGGWRLTSALLDRQEEQLLSGKGEVPLVVQEEPSSVSSGTETSGGITVDDDGKSRTDADIGGGTDDPLNTATLTLSEEEITAIIASRDDINGEYQPHEPLPGQLTMEEAVAIAEKETGHLRESGILPFDSFLDYETKASLDTWVPMDESVTTINTKNSLWTVILSEGPANAMFSVHALSGQIWAVTIGFTIDGDYYQDWDLGKLLEEYVQQFNLGEGELTHYPEGNAIYYTFEKGYLHAAATFEMTGTAANGENDFFLYMGLQTGTLPFA